MSIIPAARCPSIHQEILRFSLKTADRGAKYVAIYITHYRPSKPLFLSSSIQLCHRPPCDAHLTKRTTTFASAGVEDGSTNPPTGLPIQIGPNPHKHAHPIPPCATRKAPRCSTQPRIYKPHDLPLPSFADSPPFFFIHPIPRTSMPSSPQIHTIPPCRHATCKLPIISQQHINALATPR